MNVLNIEPYGYSDRAKKLWKELGWNYAESSWEGVLEQENSGIDALIVRLSRTIGWAELDRFPSLKYLLSATTGLDHIDLNCLNNRNIALISLKGEDEFLKNIPSTAEHTWALLMALVRRIPSAVYSVVQGQWNRDNFRGNQLMSKKLGIIGLGRTGTRVAHYASAFGLEVFYYDPYVPDHPSYTRMGSIREFLDVCDIISIHIHLNEETALLLNSENLLYLKKGAILINTSRGRVWDEEALAQALADGRLSGVATDVLATELTDIAQSPLWKAMRDGKNVLITPHLGGATWDAMWACEEFLVYKMRQITG